MFTRILIATAFTLLAVSPAGVCAGVWLALGAGWGIAAGSGGYAAVAVFLLVADLLPDPAPREALR